MTEYLTFPLPEFKNTSEAAVQPSKDDRINCVQIPVPKFDFLLGLADLTGELVSFSLLSGTFKILIRLALHRCVSTKF